MAVVRTVTDGDLALETALAAGAPVGLEMHPVMFKTIDAPALFVNGGVIELLGGHVGGAAAVSAALVESVYDLEPVLERLEGWKDAGHTHLVFSLLRSCTMRSKLHTARCEVPSQARDALVLLKRRLLSVMRHAGRRRSPACRSWL